MGRLVRARVAICLWLVTAWAAPAFGLSLEETDLVASVRATEAKAIRLLERLVNQNSGSGNVHGIRNVRHRLAGALASLDFRVQLIDPDPVRVDDVDEALSVVARETRPGGHLVAVHQARPEAPRLLVFGHMDTLFEPDHPFQHLTRRDGRLHGPGAIDDKGGIVALLMALEGLQQRGLLEPMDVIVVLNGDEEIGSLSSRELFEHWAGAIDYALGLEPGQPAERGASSIVQGRKGVGFYRLYVRGRAAHAGSSHHLGINAFEELAHKTIRIQELTDPVSGVTVNVGGEVVVRDAKRNAVPHWAQAEIDVRFRSAADGQQVEAALREITSQASVENAWLKESARAILLGGIHRPPWPENAASQDLAARYVQVAEELGREVVPEFRGGGSDGNFLAALGVPTVDGLGVVGGGSHTSDEYVLVDSLCQRAEQLAVFLLRLSRSPAPEHSTAEPQQN